MDDIYLDQIKELATISVGNGVTALSKFVGEEIKVDVPSVNIVEVEKVLEHLGDIERVVTTILIKISGDATGVVLFIFDQQSTSILVTNLTKQFHQTGDLNQMSLSALCEVANIVVGNALKAVDDFLHVPVVQSIPYSATDMIGSLLDPILSQMGEKSEKVLAIEMLISASEWNFQIVFLADPASTNKVLENIQQLKLGSTISSSGR